MKGLELSLSMIVAFLVAVMVVVVIGMLLTENISSLEDFGLAHANLTIGDL